MGKLIVIEGLDGSGKGTQTARLAQTLTRQEITVKKVSFPDYASDSSALVKMYLAGEFGARADDVNAYAASCFYAVDRYASYKKDWKCDYDKDNGVIIADRYTTSNAVHQCSKLDKNDWNSYLDWLFDFEYNKLGIPAPDLVIYLRVAPEVSRELLTGRYGGDEQKKDIHEKDAEYLARCRTAADHCADRLGWKTVECLENGVMRSVESIAAEILSLVRGMAGITLPGEG